MDNLTDPIGKYKFSEKELDKMRMIGLCVHGIPTSVLSRANLFANDRRF